MAGVGFEAVTGEIAIGTSTKTLLQIVAASNHRVLVKKWGISFKGVSNTQLPVKVSLIIQSDAGTMSSLTLTKKNQGDNETLQTTAQHTSTGEPTGSTLVWSTYVHPQTGFESDEGFSPIPIIGGGRLGIVTANSGGTDVNAIVSLEGEE